MRRNSIAAIALIAVLSACTPPPSEEELIQRAEEAVSRGDIETALPDIKSALQNNPESAPARLLYGRVYLVQQQPDNAIEEFERALRSGAGPDGLLLLAKALVLSGATAELLSRTESGEFAGLASDDEFRAALARAHVEQAENTAARRELSRITVDGNDYVDITKAIIALRLDKDTDRAKELLTVVVERSPGEAYAWSVLGVIAAADRDFAAAGEAYAKAASANPYRVGDRLQLVNAKLRAGDNDGADMELVSLEQVLPDAPPVNFLRGQLAYDAGDYRGALDALAQVLAVEPNHSGALLLSGLANIQERNFFAAESQLSDFREAVPGHLDAGIQLARVWLELGEPERAEALAREVLEEHDMNVKALGILAFALSAQGMHAESADAYQQLASLQPDSQEALMRAGTERFIAGDDEAGIADLEASVALDPNNAAARERLIAAYLADNDLVKAKAASEAYREAAPDSPRPYLVLGRVQMQEGDEDAAIVLFEEALSREPESLAARAGIASVALQNGDLKRARETLQEALGVQPGHLGTSLSLAIVLEQLGDAEGLRAVLQDAVAANEDAVEPRVVLARLALGEGRAGDALALLQPVAEVENNSQLLRVLTRTYLANDQAALADDTARRLLTLDAENANSLALAAQASAANDRPRAAQEQFDKALTLDPSNSDLRKLYVEALVRQREIGLALRQISLLPESVQNQTAVLVLRGRLALIDGDAEAATPLLQKAYANEPTNVNLLLVSAARWATGQRDAVLAELTDWLEETPDDALVRNALASRELSLGNDAAARLQYERLVQQYPENVAALNNLSWLLRTSDPELALEYSERAIELAPANAQVQDTYSMVLLENGDVERALSLNTRTLETAPDSPDLLFHRAMILVRSERSDEAVAILEKLVARPEFAGQSDAAALLATLAGT